MCNCVCVWLNLCATFGFLKDAARLRYFKTSTLLSRKRGFFLFVLYTWRGLMDDFGF
jgi:hypothetical protein